MGERSDRSVGLGRVLSACEDGLLVVVLLAMVMLAVGQIALRNLLDVGLLWADPLLRLMVLWLGLLGAAVATRDDRQITVDAVSRFLSPRPRAVVRVVTDLFTTGVTLVLAYHGARLVLDERAAGTFAFGALPAWVAQLVLPLAFGLVAWRYLRLTARHLREALRGRP